MGFLRQSSNPGECLAIYRVEYPDIEQRRPDNDPLWNE